MAGTLTRRQALAAGALGAVAALAGGAGLVQAGVLPGRYRVGRLLGACDVGGPPPTTVAPGPLRLASFPSERRGRAVGCGIAWPPGSGPGERLPVVLLLHGRRGAGAAAVRLGLGTGPGGLGVLGWSAGGAAALQLAEGDPARVAALAAASPAVPPDGAEVAAAGRLGGVAVRVDCGANDPFADGARALAAALPAAQVTVAKGCHDGAFWQRLAPAQLRFLGGNLGGPR